MPRKKTVQILPYIHYLCQSGALFIFNYGYKLKSYLIRIVLIHGSNKRNCNKSENGYCCVCLY